MVKKTYSQALSDVFESEEIARVIINDIKDGRLLSYTFHPLFDWCSGPNIHLKTIQTNSFGRRSQHPPFTKGYKRALVLGGSFAWGYGTSSNDFTPSYLLEKFARDEGIELDIVCMADQAYTSIQEIKSFIFSVDEIKPDYVICITGHNDISVAYREIFKNHIKYNEFNSFFDWGIKTGLIRKESSFKKLLRLIKYIRKEYSNPWKDTLSYDTPEKNNIPLQLTKHKIDVIASYCRLKNIKVSFILQPLISHKRNLSEMEKCCIDNIGEEKLNFFKEQYSTFSKEFWNGDSNNKDGISFIDSTSYFNEISNSVFMDLCHISDKGYDIWCKKLFKELNKKVFKID